MRTSTAILFIATLLLCLSGCRSAIWWKKDHPRPQKNAILTKDADVAAFNDFRTIDASMMESSAESKKNKSLLWNNSQAGDINRRLGVKD